MELYKTSHFREIKKQKCEYVENGCFYVKLCDYNPLFSKSERIVKRPMRGSQNNYFLTEIEANEFILKQFNNKIKGLEIDIEKYKLIATTTTKPRYVIVNGYELFSSRTFCNSETFNLKLSKTSNSVVCINNEIDCFSASSNFDLFTNFKSETTNSKYSKKSF